MIGPNAWGVQERYRNFAKEWVTSPRGSVAKVIESMARGAAEPPSPTSFPVMVVSPTSASLLERSADILLEDGSELHVEHEIPESLPFGYHTLRYTGDDRDIRLISSPGACALPDMRTWGWALQLYSLRSAKSWGMGDLGDLRELGRWSASLGARMVLLNPLSAPLHSVPQQASPYYPSSRRFRNPLYLAVEEVEGASDLPDLSSLARRGTALNERKLIDRDEIFALKMQALQEIFDRGEPGDAFGRFVEEQGEGLVHYATFCALTEELGGPWQRWPEEFRSPRSAGIAAFRERNPRRVAFHQWLQWQLDVQVKKASAEIQVMQDVAVGVDPAGADAWIWQGVYADGVRVGAPPDRFNTKGQDWGVPPFDPWALRAAAYEPFIEMIRGTLRHAHGLRIDHVMGLFRLYWIPEGEDPAGGVYVRYPFEDLLDIVALESHRSNAYVVGEDLGTVEDEVREELYNHRILSYRLFLFEGLNRWGYPRESLAAVSTHDLPTIAGLWTGSDLQLQKDLGLDPNEKATEKMVGYVAAAAQVDRAADVSEVTMKTYRWLSETDSSIVTATFEDALGAEDRPNLPGTVDERPNWSIPLPKSLEEIMTDDVAISLARLLDGRG